MVLSCEFINFSFSLLFQTHFFFLKIQNVKTHAKRWQKYISGDHFQIGTVFKRKIKSHLFVSHLCIYISLYPSVFHKIWVTYVSCSTQIIVSFIKCYLFRCRNICVLFSCKLILRIDQIAPKFTLLSTKLQLTEKVNSITLPCKSFFFIWGPIL